MDHVYWPAFELNPRYLFKGHLNKHTVQYMFLNTFETGDTIGIMGVLQT